MFDMNFEIFTKDHNFGEYVIDLILDLRLEAHTYLLAINLIDIMSRSVRVVAADH